MRFRLVCKPSSVIEGNHQSSHDIAAMLKRSRERTNSPYVPTPCTSRSLQRVIVTNISSELLPHFFTIAFLGLYLSVALFLKLPWLDVIKRDCSVVLGLSSLKMSASAQPTQILYSFKKNMSIVLLL